MAGSQLVSCSVSTHTVKADEVFVITVLHKRKQNDEETCENEEAY